MKINKYNVQKKDEASGRIQGGGLFLNSPSGNSSDVADEAKKLKETHLIFGQPFNGTQDVSGDISNAENITASGGDIRVKAVEDAEGKTGGNIYADGNIEAGGDIAAKGSVTADSFNGQTADFGFVNIAELNASKGTITNLKGNNLNYDTAEIRQAVIDALRSVEITTEKLTVTKSAHFFELIIDKIKAAGGSILLTPADGFRVEAVQKWGDNYRLFWKATDGEKAISNMWQEGDQAICQTFNNATVGTSYNVSNKYYWTVVTAIGKESFNGLDYHYIEISGTDYDGEVNPEVGDEIAMLGSRNEEAERQSAIYLAAYSSIDPTLKAPLICQYHGINNFDLKSHKYSWLAANGSTLRGNIQMVSGQDIEDYIDYRAITVVSTEVVYAVSDSGTTAPTSGWTSKVPYVPPANFLWSKTTVTYSDGTVTTSYSVARSGANGKKGDQGDAGADGNSYSANLLTNTQLFEGDEWYNRTYWEDANETYLGCKVLKRSANGQAIGQDFEVEEGQTYTFSAYVKSEGGDVRFYFTNLTSGVEAGIVTPQNKDIPESSEWSRQTVTVKATKSGVIRFRAQKATGTGAVYLAGFKLEKGENPNTVWTPHPSEIVGKDADYYKLQPLKEYAVVNIGRDLGIDFQYQILHIVGNESQTIPASADGFFVRLRDNATGAYINLSMSVTPSYKDAKYLEQYENNRDEITQYFEVQLMKGSQLIERRIVPVILAPAASLEITNDISATVSNTVSRLGYVENDVSTLKQTAESITSTVSRHTTQINSLNGTVGTHTSQISKLQQTAEGLTSTVESHTKDINGNKDSISKLQQTANNIQLQVNNISLQVNDKKIVLDGDTEVNGTVNVNKDGTGFRLNGSQGESFTIGSNDVGTYNSFENKTYQNWWHSFNKTTVNFDKATKDFSISSVCTNLKAGQRIRITNLICSKTDYSFANSSASFLTVSILYKGLQVAIGTVNPTFTNGSYSYQGTSGMNGTKAAILDYTAANSGEYSIRINGEMKGTVSGYTELNLMAAVEISLSAFGQLTYNGFGFNFGAGKVAFIGNDAMIFKMGADAGMKLTTADGLQRLVPESYRYSSANILHSYTNSAKWIGMNDFIVRIVSDLSSGYNKGSIDIVSPKDEMLVVKAISQAIILVLPAASSYAGKSYIIKNRSTSDNLFVSGGSLTTANAAGNIITYNNASGYNDSCNITTAAGTTTYRGLMKCYRNSHRLISDGEKWIDCLLSN